jgi:hypothetical protein
MDLNKRYDFVFFFDVKDGNPTAIRTLGTFHGLTPRQDMVL